ncbi:MAG: M20 family metallopeptidase [Desulfobacterales bacterium]|nr:M20 family metallopeptidase [Desulfobacterales bacterium]
MNLETLKTRIQDNVDSVSKELIGLSYRIHANPEVSYKEEKASKWLADYLEEKGFKVERGAADLPTAFVASYGKNKPAIAFLAEYDALPEIGHGCGHNIIGTAAAGAGIAAKLIADELGAKIMVIGCPGEELLGGKAFMVEKGIFDEVDAALEMHPMAVPENWAGAKMTASSLLDVQFWGKPSHAAFDPWNGVSALAAMIQSFVHIDSLRLHIKDRSRIAGVITDGGKAPNVIPEHSAGRFLIRTAQDGDLDDLREKVIKCFEAAAISTGCQLEYHLGPRCNAMQNNSVLLELWRSNMAALGRQVGEMNINSGSTDVGNVSVITPSIHPFLSISEETLPGHSAQFAAAAVSKAGDKAVLDGAKALAMTAADIAAQLETLARAKEELKETRKRERIFYA